MNKRESNVNNRPWKKIKPCEIEYDQYYRFLIHYWRAEYFYQLFRENDEKFLKNFKLIKKEGKSIAGYGLIHRAEACRIAWLGQLHAINEFFVNKRLLPEGIKLTDTKFNKSLKRVRDIGHHLIIDRKKQRDNIDFGVGNGDFRMLLSIQGAMKEFLIKATRHFLDINVIKNDAMFLHSPESEEIYKKAAELNFASK